MEKKNTTLTEGSVPNIPMVSYLSRSNSNAPRGGILKRSTGTYGKCLWHNKKKNKDTYGTLDQKYQ